MITGVSGSGKSTLAFDIIFNEGPAPLSRIAERLCAPVRAARGAARRGCHLRHSAHGRHRAAHQPRRPQEHGGHAHRDLPLPAPALREARHAVLPHLRRGHRAADLEVHRRAPAETAQGLRILLLAPLVVARKGYYTELAKWANARGYKQLRVDGEMLTTDQWPRLNRFKEHTIELPVEQITVQKDSADLLERNVIKALDIGKGLVHVLDLDSRRKNPRCRCSASSAPALPAARASPSSIRACSRSTANTAGARAASWAPCHRVPRRRRPRTHRPAGRAAQPLAVGDPRGCAHLSAGHRRARAGVLPDVRVDDDKSDPGEARDIEVEPGVPRRRRALLRHPPAAQPRRPAGFGHPRWDGDLTSLDDLEFERDPRSLPFDTSVSRPRA